MTGKPAEPTYKGEAIERSFRALACFTPERPVWSLEALVAATKVPRATLLGILNTLVRHGMLRRRSDGTYLLGFTWLQLGTLRRNQVDLRMIAQPIMRRLRDAVDETVILSVRDGDQRVHVDYVESMQHFRRLSQIGNSRPLHIGASGLALLANLPPRALDGYMARLKEHLDTAEIAHVETGLAAVRRDGCATVIGTMLPETAAVSAGVRLHSGECAAITISCPTERIDRRRASEFAGLVRQAIDEIARQLGGAA